MMASRVFSLNLGVAISNDQQISEVVAHSTPKEVPLFRNRSIRQIACGLQQTVFVLNDGTVYVHNQDDAKPELISSLETLSIVQAACGDGHNVVISNKGRIMSWGHDSQGQCGHGIVSINRPKPRVIKSLSKEFIVQVTCGSKHTLALAKSNPSGKLFAWGDNSSCQLGFSTHPEHTCAVPTEIASLTGLPIKQATCGGDHSLALTFSGAVFGWGCNESGQLEQYDERVSVYKVPHELEFLRDQQMSYIACGVNHSVFRSLTGKVIGLGKSKDTIDSWSKRFEELNEDKKIICGKLHTLAFIPTSNNLYIFGPKSQDDSNMTLQGSHESLSKYCYGDTMDANESAIINNIFCGGITCYFVISESPSNMECNPNIGDLDDTSSDQIIYQLDEKSISELAAVSSSSVVPKNIAITIQNLFSSSACLNRSFLTGDHYCCCEENPGLDLVRARKAFETLSRNHTILSLVSQVIHAQLIPTVLKSPLGIEALRLYLLLLEFPTMRFPESYLQSIFSITNALCSLSPQMSKVIDTWIGNLPPDRLQHLIAVLKNVIVHLVSKHTFSLGKEMTTALDMLRKLYKINEDKDEIVSYTTFYIPEASDILFLQGTPMNLMLLRTKFLETYPFILENNVKMFFILIESHTQKMMGDKNEGFNTLFCQNLWQAIMGNLPVVVLVPLVLTINRHDIVASTFKQLNNQSQQDFKKPLKVKFEDEPEIYSVILRKDFFLLIFQEILDPKFGMFKEYSKARTIWFNPQSFEDRSMFRLVGVLCGLAIYNQVLVDLPFPLALYKKLLKRPVRLSDFKELDEGMAGSLQGILDYDDFDLQDVFDLNFQISTEFRGNVHTVDLKKGGKDIPVTIDNKQEYVDLYIDYIFNESVKDQYNAFAEGFLQVCDGIILQAFHPQELITLVVGNNIYDWDEFERLVEYRGFFNKEYKTIKLFWDVFHDLTLQEKKKFLAFLTGSDRIPVQGMSVLHVIIQPALESTDFLPTALTCHNLLQLPLYESKEKMREKLLKALKYGQGFGLL